jgi:hypothetical protein
MRTRVDSRQSAVGSGADSRVSYLLDLEEIVRMRDLEVRGLKERVAELEQKVAACGDGAILAGKWRAVAMALMGLMNELAAGRGQLAVGKGNGEGGR